MPTPRSQRMLGRPNRYLPAVLALAATLSGCAHVTNVPLCTAKVHSAGACEFDHDPKSTYRFAPRPDKETLIIVTLSGGGTRAAALAFGTLKMLATLPPVKDAYDNHAKSLLDQVDIISSVSGGSVTAGWYALKGQDGLTESDPEGNGRLWNFLNSKLTGKLAWQALNPWTLGRYTFTPYTRSDVLADFFDARLFGKATYDTVLQRYKSEPNQPYVILNATDLGHETIFPFTQGRFDLLCSDIRPYRLADAVAASANFPLAFSALGVENYSGCEVQSTNSWRNDGPPQWLNYYRGFDSPPGNAINSARLNEVRSARLGWDYLDSPKQGNQDRYLHLLDGGVADNLGMRSTLAIEDDPARVPSLYLRLGLSRRPDGYQNIRRILYVVVNARTRDPGALDKSEMPPGEIRTALRMSDTLLDSSTLADQDYLIAELEAIANGPEANSDSTGGFTTVQSTDASDCDLAHPPHGAFVSCKAEAQPRHAPPGRHLKFYVASVDFEMIPDKDCRDRAWLLPTNWGLERNQIEGLRDLAQVILSRSPELRGFYKDVAADSNNPNSASDGAVNTEAPDSYEHACRLIKSP
jgi:NTE family protein